MFGVAPIGGANVVSRLVGTDRTSALRDLIQVLCFLQGGCDKTARIFDCRSPETHQTWSLNGECERISWDPLRPFVFFSGTSTGKVQCFDCRKGNQLD